MKNLLAVCVCLLHLYALAGAQAPGDEDDRCLQRTATIRPPTYPPNIMPLMESLYYLQLLGENGAWKTIGENRWVTGLGGVCQREVQGCSFNNRRAGTDNYLFTQHISTTGAEEIMLNVTSTFQPCFVGGCGPDYNQFHVLVYETDVQDRLESMDPSNYRWLGKVNIPTGSSIFVPMTKVFSFVPQRRGFYIALYENGTCATVSRLVAYAFRCPARTIGLVEHNNIFAPPMESNRNSATLGQCSENSSQQNGNNRVTEPVCECGPRGLWAPGPDCECNPGYHQITADDTAACMACDEGTYKPTFSNEDGCLTCPPHSNSAAGSSMCACDPGFFRAPGEGVDMECTGPPSAPVNLRVDTDGITNTTVPISWSPPANNGGRDDTRYNVFYQLSGWLHLGFMEGSQGVLGLRATVQGLLPVREYVIRVVAENGVSDQVGTTEGRFADIRATTTEGVPNRITLFARRRGSTFTWQPPAVTNGQLTGFDFRLFREDEDDTIIELEDLDFCYGPIPDDVPEGSGDVHAQVRARTAVGPGPWSEAILYIESPPPSDNVGTQAPLVVIIPDSSSTESTAQPSTSSSQPPIIIIPDSSSTESTTQPPIIIVPDSPSATQPLTSSTQPPIIIVPDPPSTDPPPSDCPDYPECSYEFCRNSISPCILNRRGCDGECQISHCRACFSSVGSTDSSACNSCLSYDDEICLLSWAICLPGILNGRRPTSSSDPFVCIPHPCI